MSLDSRTKRGKIQVSLQHYTKVHLLTQGCRQIKTMHKHSALRVIRSKLIDCKYRNERSCHSYRPRKKYKTGLVHEI